MDIEEIVDAAETEAPALRDVARRFLKTEAAAIEGTVSADQGVVARHARA